MSVKSIMNVLGQKPMKKLFSDRVNQRIDTLYPEGFSHGIGASKVSDRKFFDKDGQITRHNKRVGDGY